MKDNKALNKLFTPLEINSIIDDSIFADIAKKIICNSCIENGSGAKYIPVEIEFYYHSPKFPLNNGKDYEHDHITYPRYNVKAGQLLYHYSGIDICFQTKVANGNEVNKPEFGGILIRSLLKMDKNGNEMIYGPLCCKDVLLNEAVETLPTFEYPSKDLLKLDLADKPTIRVGIKDDGEKTVIKLRYYAKQFENKVSKENIIERWAYNGGNIKKVASQSYNMMDKIK